jgi:lipopolysaccharide biosynthesis protein
MARTRHKYSTQCRQQPAEKTPRPCEIAIVVHAFYPEILHEIIDHWQQIPALQGIWLVITTPPEKAEECRKVFESRNLNSNLVVIATENHGRDILPFCKIYNFLVRIGIKVYCKLHTKKSKHREDGAEWRRELFSGLLDPALTESIIQALNTNSGIGIILPEDHIMPMTEFFGANCDTVCSLSSRLGLPACRLNELPLVAGSMFWARIESLVPMHMLYSEERFEKEYGQVDGTFAHAFERMLSVSCASLGLEVANCELQKYSTGNYKKDYTYSSRG